MSEAEKSFLNKYLNHKYDFAQNTLLCSSPPSLKEITLTKLAVKLFEDDRTLYDKVDFGDVTASVFSVTTSEVFDLHDLLGDYIFKELVKAKASPLVLPLTCKEDLVQRAKVILKEIKKYFSSQEKISTISPKNIKIYQDNLCWTQYGKIDYLKTAHKLLKCRNLSVREKYIIACNHCLVDKIKSLHKKLPENLTNYSLRNEHRPAADENFESDRKFRLVLYWTLHVRGEDEKYSLFTNGSPTNDYLLKWAIVRGQDAIVQYIWENLADDVMKGRVVMYAQLTTRNIPNYHNIMLYLFDQMTPAQRIEACIKMGNYILKALLNGPRDRYVLVSVARNVIKYIRKMNVSYAFHALVICWLENLLDSNLYHKVWQDCASHFHLKIKENFREIYVFLHDELLNDRYDIVTERLLVKLANSKTVTYSHHFTVTFFRLLLRNQLGRFETFLNEMLASETSVSSFKENFIERKIVGIFSILISVNKYNLMELALKRFYNEEEAKRFKCNLPYAGDADIIRKILHQLYPDRSNLAVLDQFLCWCFDGDLDEVADSKAIIFNFGNISYWKHRDLLSKQINLLIKAKEWKIIEDYWKWIFSACRNEIQTPEEKFSLIKKILYTSGRRRGFVMLISRFLRCCFTQTEIDELKLENNEELKMIVMNLLELYRYSKVDDLLKVCFCSNDVKIQRFKLDFMKSMGCELIFKMIGLPERVVALFRWFNQTVEAGRLFKEKFNAAIRWTHKLQNFEEDDGEPRPSKAAWITLGKMIDESIETLSRIAAENDFSRPSTSRGETYFEGQTIFEKRGATKQRSKEASYSVGKRKSSQEALRGTKRKVELEHTSNDGKLGQELPVGVRRKNKHTSPVLLNGLKNEQKQSLRTSKTKDTQSSSATKRKRKRSQERQLRCSKRIKAQEPSLRAFRKNEPPLRSIRKKEPSLRAFRKKKKPSLPSIGKRERLELRAFRKNAQEAPVPVTCCFTIRGSLARSTLRASRSF